MSTTIRIWEIFTENFSMFMLDKSYDKQMLAFSSGKEKYDEEFSS